MNKVWPEYEYAQWLWSLALRIAIFGWHATVPKGLRDSADAAMEDAMFYAWVAA